MITDPEELGFPEGIPGHRLSDAVVESSSNNWQPDQMMCRCDCGIEFRGYATASGKMSKFATNHYKNHLIEKAADPEEEFLVGKVTKQRIELVVKVIHRDHPQAYDAACISPHSAFMKNWAKPSNDSWLNAYGWGIFVERYSTKGTALKAPMKIEGVYRSKTEALIKARHFLDREGEDGHKVEYADGPGVSEQPLPTFKGTLSAMLAAAEEAATSGDLGEVSTALEELDKVLSLVDVIKARRDELAEVKEQRTVGLLN